MTNIIVLIPHYNSYKELLASIDSINETINVDVLIVDDGSKKSIPNLSEIEQLYKNGKVFLEILVQNRGIEYALNKGLELIQNMSYDYIGRLDCGDFCAQDRFGQQLEYLETHQNVYLLGTWVNIINTNKEHMYVLKHPETYKEIKNKMYLNSMFVHPSVVFRTSILDSIGYYPTDYKAAEDYAFFFNVIKKFKAENLPKPLLDYVIDENSISSTKRKLQVKSRIRIIKDNFYLGYYPIYGLFRNILLYFITRDTSNTIKKFLGK